MQHPEMFIFIGLGNDADCKDDCGMLSIVSKVNKLVTSLTQYRTFLFGKSNSATTLCQAILSIGVGIKSAVS